MKMLELEANIPFSQSILWKSQEDYFQRLGVKAWSQAVPFYVTSNLFIAHAYALTLFRFLQEGHASGYIDAKQPVYIIETGTGSGKLSFHIVSELSRLCERFHVDKSTFCYVMTDFTESNIAFWQQQAPLQPFVKQGILDFAAYNLNQSNDIHLINRDMTLSKSTVKNPLIAIANYVFDTVPHDLFQIKNGNIKQGVCSVRTLDTNLDEQDQVKELNQLRADFSFSDVDIEQLDDPIIKKILQSYTNTLKDTALLIPTGGLRCINHLRQLSDDRLLMLVGDKGHYEPCSLDNLPKPHLAFHGSFSMMVNFHAVTEYIKALGGDVLIPESQQGLKIFAYSVGKSFNELPETQYAYGEHNSLFSSSEFLTMKNNVIQKYGNVELKDFIATMRLSRWDPTIMLSLYQRVLHHVRMAPQAAKLELKAGFYTILNNIYPLPNNQNFYLGLGQLFDAIGDKKAAQQCYGQSKALYKQDAPPKPMPNSTRPPFLQPPGNPLFPPGLAKSLGGKPEGNNPSAKMFEELLKNMSKGLR